MSEFSNNNPNDTQKKHADHHTNFYKRSTNVNVTLSLAVDVEVMLTLQSVMINVFCLQSKSCS